MSSATKVTRLHLDKKAVIYIRQSSREQVLNNLESQKRQYNLKEKALNLGWPKERCLVIDDDQGISGAHTENRPGYQKLITLIALQEVGIIFGIEISRLTRNCSDWYQLLDLSSSFAVLIGDEDAIYDPSDFNDRLLLGLKGTISEVELQQIKSRMYRGRINKAKRGELYVPVPVGYERDLQGAIRISSDESVRNSLTQILRLFKNIGSIRSVLRELLRRGEELPYLRREMKKEVVRWRKPRYDAIYLILKNPFYAGLYAYGKRSVKYNAMKKTHVYKKNERKDWDIVIPDHHEKYLTLEQFEENEKKLRANSFVNHSALGAAREGANLLQGLVYCGKCGRKMSSTYPQGKFAYVCNHEHFREAGERCNYAGAKRVDQSIEHLVLETLNDGTIDLTFEMLKTHREELKNQKHQWQQKLKRLEYEEKLSRRRYESVDPDNRLVASTLESEWNASMRKLEEAKREFAVQFKNPETLELTVSEVKACLGDLPTRWREGKISLTDKKEIFRCLIEKITVHRKKDHLELEVYWHGGSVTSLQVRKRMISDPKVYDRIKELAETCADQEIADKLNEEKIKTYHGKKWTISLVMSFRKANQIASIFNHAKELRLPDSGFIPASEVAHELGITKTTITNWIKLGFFEVRRGNRNHFWIKLDSALIEDLKGKQSEQAGDIPLNELLARKVHSFAEAIAWAKAQDLRIIRIKQNYGFKFVFRRSA
jgi:DNA invertase Pin-like site-specific DNA recombinase